MKKSLITFTLLALLISPLSAGELEDALKAYENGSYITAYEKLLPFAKQGNAQAQYRIGFMYRSGFGVEKNLTEAIKWYTLAAKQDHVYAQIKLGDMYSGGYYEIEENKEEAIKWYKLAIEQGNADAQNSLAIMYKREGDKYSHGAEENKEAADKWYRLAFENYLPLAQKGDANAQDILGSMYYKGLGVKQNEKEAMKWYAQALRSYTLAVNQKDGDSFLFKLAFLYYQLARIYYSRDGDIEKDLVRALMWTSLSAEIAPSAPMLGYYNEARIEYFYEKLLEELSPKQIKEAKRLAKACKESNYKEC